MFAIMLGKDVYIALAAGVLFLHILFILWVVFGALLTRSRPWLRWFHIASLVAVIWNSMQLFVTHLVQAGTVAFWHFLSTGQVRRLDTMMVALGCIGHFILIFACLAASVEDGTAERRWSKFAGGGAIAVA